VDRCIPNVLVNMISMDHRLNVESRHPFQVMRVDSCSYIDKGSSAREIEFQHVTPINNVGVACLGQWICKFISTKFSKTAIRENLDPRNFCAIR